MVQNGRLKMKVVEMFSVFLRPSFARAVCAAVLFGGVWAMPSTSQAQLPGENNSIQVKFIMAPVVSKSGKQRNPRAITPIMMVPKADDTVIVCRKVARINDAILQVLFQYPLVEGKGRKLELESHGQILTKSINRALGKNMVSDVRLVDGVVNLGKGASARLPFTVHGCGRVMEEFERRLKELKGE